MIKKEFTKIPNELLEVLAKARLSNYEIRYIFVVLRKTFGFNKPSDYIANSQFVKATGIRKGHIWRTEKRLLWRKIITKQGKRLSFNINYGMWKELPRGGTVTKTGIKVTDSGKKVTQIGGHKRNYTKETIQKKTSKEEQSSKMYVFKIIFSFAYKKGISLEEKNKRQSFIRRSLRPAQNLTPYNLERIKEVMDWLEENVDFKWTLETVGKYIDEDLTRIKVGDEAEIKVPEYAKRW